MATLMHQGPALLWLTGALKGNVISYTNVFHLMTNENVCLEKCQKTQASDIFVHLTGVGTHTEFYIGS